MICMRVHERACVQEAFNDPVEDKRVDYNRKPGKLVAQFKIIYCQTLH